MHKHFPDWYREIGLVPTDEVLKKRWEGIAEFVQGLDVTGLLNLVPAHQGELDLNPSFINEFTKVFVAKDSTFPNRDNANEIRVLAGSCLAEVIENSEEIAALAAASIVCANFETAYKEPPVNDILKASMTRICQISSDIRADLIYPELREYKFSHNKALLDLKKSSEANNLTQVLLVSPLTDVILELGDDVSKLYKAIREYINTAKKRLEIVSEEINALWWLNADWSETMHTSFSEMDSNAAPIVAGAELAELITTIPGPMSSKAILERVISKNLSADAPQEISIAKAVNALSEDWMKSKAQSYLDYVQDFPNLFPLHFAVNIAEMVGDKGWESGYNKNTKRNSAKSCSRSTIAYQYYLESLVLAEAAQLR